MSLYYDTVSLLANSEAAGGSFKSRVYNSRLKSSPAQIYALVTEASKWDILLKEVIENASILPLEPKLTPLLSLLLVHDYLLSKKGIAAPPSHPLRMAVERHKTRLKAELVKSRLRRRCTSLSELKSWILRAKQLHEKDGGVPLTLAHPRWVRINNLRTTLDRELNTTFSTWDAVTSPSSLSSADDKKYCTDKHIPDLLAVSPGVDLISSPAYKEGKLILQDKASCFPAYLLLGGHQEMWKGDIIDACAAPGNKTTHLASLLCSQQLGGDLESNHPIIFSLDVSHSRSKTLQKMVSLAGADNLVHVLPGQDFLATSPNDRRFHNVTAVLLDPSCSGSGIVGRDDIPHLTLPSTTSDSRAPTARDSRNRSRKRKFQTEDSGNSEHSSVLKPGTQTDGVDVDRLTKLSNLQLRIITHAFSFPAATRVTYSTCSVHIQENEAVVSRALASAVAKRGSWRVLHRDEQVDGLRKWKYRGIKQSDLVGGNNYELSEQEREACLRCWPGDEEQTGGFFLVGFVRNIEKHSPGRSAGRSESADAGEIGDGGLEGDDSEEWEGFS